MSILDTLPLKEALAAEQIDEISMVALRLLDALTVVRESELVPDTEVERFHGACSAVLLAMVADDREDP